MASKPTIKQPEPVHYVNQCNVDITEEDTNYVDWEEEVDTIYTDNYNITHVKFKRK